MKGTNPLISVIIPVYNVEKYLRQCVDSVLTQTYQNLEIILIDDESTDNCGRICDEYAKQDGRVRVIHQKNQGAYVARNAGLQVARGEYIGFVDSDDYIKPDMYQILLSEILKSQADIVMCGQVLLKPDGEEVVKFPHEKEYIYTDNAVWLKDLMTYAFAYHVIWNKLFKKQCLEGVCFNPQLRNTGDFEFLLDLLGKPLCVAYIPQPLYYYVFRADSTTHQPSIRFFSGKYLVWKHAVKIARKMQKNNVLPWLDDVYKKRFLPKAFMLAVFIILFDTKNEYIKELREVRYIFHLLQKSSVRFSLKPIYRMWTYCFGNYPNLVTTILRLPGLRQLTSYYILHR